MSALAYIEENNLPCVLWLDSTTPAYVNITGNTFTWQNRYGSSDYNFIQADANKHPSFLTNGISFSGNQVLYAQDKNILLDTSSYTMVAVTRGNLLFNQQVLDIGKANPLLPKLIELRLNTSNLDRSFSLANFKQVHSMSYPEGYAETVAISHNSKLGRTKLSIDNNTITTKQDISKGYILDNLSNSFLIGNDISNTYPFRGKILHFLLFIPEIDDIHLSGLSQLLEVDALGVIKLSDEFYYSNNLNIDTSISGSLSPSLIYSLPVLKYSNCIYRNIDLSLEALLLLAYVWDDITTTQWNALTEADWNGIRKGLYP